MFSRVDLSVPPSKRDGVSIGFEAEEALKHALEPLDPKINALTPSLLLFSRTYFTTGTPEERARIFNHAMNDFTLLMKHLWEGNGRDAVRTSRSLYEHLVNYCYVASSAEGAERYLLHRTVTHKLISESTKRLPLLRRVERKREEHRLRKIAQENSRKYTESRRRFGNGFSRDWTSVNLYDRAKQSGLEGHYDTYRLFSQVTHGSAGGTLGTLRPNNNSAVHRIGPSLELASLAFPEGISFFRDLISRIQAIESIDAGELIARLNALINDWQTYRSACRWVDENLWPEGSPAPVVTIIAVYQTGRCRWFRWEPALKMMAPAEPPANHQSLEDSVKEQIDLSPAGELAEYLAGRPVTVAVSGVVVAVSDTATWFPAEGLMQYTEPPKLPIIPDSFLN